MLYIFANYTHLSINCSAGQKMLTSTSYTLRTRHNPFEFSDKSYLQVNNSTWKSFPQSSSSSLKLLSLSLSLSVSFRGTVSNRPLCFNCNFKLNFRLPPSSLHPQEQLMFIFPFSSVLCQRPLETSNVQVKEEILGDIVYVCAKEGRGKGRRQGALGIIGDFNHLCSEECREGLE